MISTKRKFRMSLSPKGGNAIWNLKSSFKP
jgi:hypothetical protein